MNTLPLLNNPTLRTARTSAAERRRELDEILSAEVSKPYTYASDATSLGVFGSLARSEWTMGSDLDWTYLVKLNLVQHIREFVRQSPLEILARSVEHFSVADETQRDIFSSYTEFLEVLDHKELREHLISLRADQSRNDKTFQRIKKISSVFEKALDHVFFENSRIARLTRKYGVF